MSTLLNRVIIFCLSIVLLSGCASSIEKASARLAALEALEANIAQPMNAGQSETFTLHELLKWTQRSSVSVAKDEIREILNIVDIDQADSLDKPALAITSSLGKTAFVQRNNPSGMFAIAPTINWDFFRYFESEKSKAALLKKSDLLKLNRSLTTKQINLEVVRLYFEYTANLRLQALAEKRRTTDDVKIKLLRLRASINDDDRAPLEKLTHLYQQSTASTDAIYARTEHLKKQLFHFCRLPSNAKIEVGEASAMVDDRIENFSDYLQLAAIQSESYRGAQILSEVAAEGIQLTNLSRWTKFSFSSSLSNLLSNVSAPPFALISWTYELFDRGEFDRQILRAKAQALLARLEVQDQQKQVIQLAGNAWLSLMDKSADYHSEAVKYREIQLEFIAAQYLLKNSAISADEFQERQLEFIDRTNFLFEKRDRMILAKAQYLSLISDDSNNWIDRL